MNNHSHATQLKSADKALARQEPMLVPRPAADAYVRIAPQRPRSRVYTVTTAEPARWLEVLERCNMYDVYHLAEYHKLIEEQDAHRAEFFVFERGDALIAMPFVLRSLAGVPGLDAQDYWDSTSVYGYAGPLSNQIAPTADVVQGYMVALQRYLASRRIVTAFTRLHPFMDEQAAYLQLPGSQVLDVGPTVAIDLTLSPEAQQKQLRGSHRREIEQARNAGIHVLHDQTWCHLDDFIQIYGQTMQRIGAADSYLFDRRYFERLRELLGNRLHLFVALKDNVVIAASLFIHCNSLIQYHLSGTHADYLKVAPNKLILDAARQWGNEVGASALHLGGGVGSKKDGLFRFKAGFSKQTRRFKIWRMVTNEAVYAQLTEQHRLWSAQNGYEASDYTFFPAYRSPAAPK